MKTKFIFFFQAEDGIRDYKVTGVQTCALPIWLTPFVAKTDPAAGKKGVSLLVVEEGMAGFTRNGPLHKVGLAAQDTAELVFDNVRVPVANVLGEVNDG